MDAELESPLAELLIRLVEIDGGKYEQFVPTFPGGGATEANLVGFDDEHVPEGPTRELAKRGYLDMEPTDKKLGKFTITEKGRRKAAQLSPPNPTHDEAHKPLPQEVDLSWSAVEPVLRSIERVWREHGAPELGLNGNPLAQLIGKTPDELKPILSELQRGDWIEYRQPLSSGLPNGIRPSPKAIAYLNAWPTGDGGEFGRELLAAIEDRIEAEPDPEKKSKWRTALKQGGEGFRELLVEVAAAIASQQVRG